MMYPKIKNVWLRDPDNNFKTLREGIWTMDEFEYLAESEWIVTEKIDGTNIRITYKDRMLSVGGRTDNAQIPTPLLTHLMNLNLKIVNKVNEMFGDDTVIFYGEGYGGKIQKKSEVYGPDQQFILFDININGLWQPYSNVQVIAQELNLPTVPLLGYMNLFQAIELARVGFQTKIGSGAAEGVIAKPTVELQDRFGARIITKIKTKDFQEN